MRPPYNGRPRFNDNNAVNVVGHHHPFIQPHIGKMFRDLLPTFRRDFPERIVMDGRALHMAEQAFTILRAYRDEIRACGGIIIPPQANGTASAMLLGHRRNETTWRRNGRPHRYDGHTRLNFLARRIPECPNLNGKGTGSPTLLITRASARPIPGTTPGASTGRSSGARWPRQDAPPAPPSTSTPSRRCCRAAAAPCARR